jgi:hypothetical protein
MQIDGRQFEQFSKILRDAFTLQRFDEMLRFRLDINAKTSPSATITRKSFSR